jgi:cation transport protein ChaC
MALDAGGECTGVAYHVEEQNLISEMKILWRREMPLGTYRPAWTDARSAEGMPVGPILAFVADEETTRYVGNMPYRDIVERLKTASGMLGTNADYLSYVQVEIGKIGVSDPYIDQLVLDMSKAGSI